MKRLLSTRLILSGLWLASTFAVRAEIDDENRPPAAAESFRNDSRERRIAAFARVRYLDGAVSAIRDDGAADDLNFNEPVYRGDRIESLGGGRVELQLPDGTLVRLDRDSVLDVEELLDPSWSRSSPSLLGLNEGSLQLDIDDSRDGDAIRIDTPAASIYPLERGAVRIDIDRGDWVRVMVEYGRVEVAGERGSVILNSGERTTVRSGGRPSSPARYNAMGRDAFGAWVAHRDDVYDFRASRGREYDDLPDEVRPYYGELSQHGRWYFDDDYGWCWLPRVSADWRPYWSGAWSSGPYGPVWVSSDPWGWCTYRYGRWEHRARFGWCWIPGRVFAPAHVYWYYGPSYVGWCPLGFYDRPVQLSISFGWGGGWFDHCPWAFIPYGRFYRVDPRHVRPPRGELVNDIRRGVVTRRPVLENDQGRDHGGRPVGRGGGPRVAVPRGERNRVDSSVYERARELAQRRVADARPATGEGAPRLDDPKESKPFRERERAEARRRGELNAPKGDRERIERGERGERPDGGVTPRHGGGNVRPPRESFPRRGADGNGGGDGDGNGNEGGSRRRVIEARPHERRGEEGSSVREFFDRLRDRDADKRSDDESSDDGTNDRGDQEQDRGNDDDKAREHPRGQERDQDRDGKQDGDRGRDRDRGQQADRDRRPRHDPPRATPKPDAPKPKHDGGGGGRSAQPRDRGNGGGKKDGGGKRDGGGNRRHD